MSDFDLGYRDPIWSRLEEKDEEIKRLKAIIVSAAAAMEQSVPGCTVCTDVLKIAGDLREAAK